MTSYTKIALIFACDYPDTPFRLRGCVNDGNAVKKFLIEKRGFDPANVTTLYDKKMTRAAMLTAIDEFVAKGNSVATTSRNIPAMFFHFSGHGLQIDQYGNSRSVARQLTNIPKLGSEAYNDADADEAIVPYDARTAGYISDNTLYERLVKPLNQRAELFALTDCCNSGTNLDLPYKGTKQASDDHNLRVSVIHLAGCKDIQLSAEVNGAGLATTRFLEVVGPRVESLEEFRQAMDKLPLYGNSQNPQVSVSRKDMINGFLFPWLVADVSGPPVGGQKKLVTTGPVVPAAQQVMPTLQQVMDYLLQQQTK